MNVYEVEVQVSIVVSVEADSEEEAEDYAYEDASGGLGDWTYVGTEILSVEELSEV